MKDMVMRIFHNFLHGVFTKDEVIEELQKLLFNDELTADEYNNCISVIQCFK